MKSNKATVYHKNNFELTRSLAPKGTRLEAKDSAKNTSVHQLTFCGDPVTRKSLWHLLCYLQLDVGLSIEGKAHFPYISKDHWCTSFVDKYINIWFTQNFLVFIHVVLHIFV